MYSHAWQHGIYIKQTEHPINPFITTCVILLQGGYSTASHCAGDGVNEGQPGSAQFRAYDLMQQL